MGCGSSQSFEDKSLSAASDVPEAFQPKQGVKFEDNACKSPLVDPRDGTEIIMVSAQGGKGDYRVPSGMYGVGNRELLRLNCNTGQVIGVVRQ
ncbi:hypothetical protein GCM10023115_53060 [Pontixanthobacter gangjinensis]